MAAAEDACHRAIERADAAATLLFCGVHRDIGVAHQCFGIRRVIRENLAWAFAYNLILLPVAAGALYPRWGILLRPEYAGAAMALSSISVALNSLRLRRKDVE